MKESTPIINRSRLNEVLQRLSTIFVEEKLSPFEIKILLDVIMNNVDALDDIYTKAQLKQALSAGLSLKDDRPPMGVS